MPAKKKTKTEALPDFQRCADRYDFSVLRDLRTLEGLTIMDLAAKTGISPAVISKLERNQVVAGLGTLFRLARVFGLTATEMLGMIESRTAQVKKETVRTAKNINYRQIEFQHSKCFYAEAPKGATRASNPDVQRHGYEVCWVLSGKVKITLPYNTFVLTAGDNIEFDALVDNSYEVLEDSVMIIQLIRKQKRI